MNKLTTLCKKAGSSYFPRAGSRKRFEESEVIHKISVDVKIQTRVCLHTIPRFQLGKSQEFSFVSGPNTAAAADIGYLGAFSTELGHSVQEI